MILKVSGVAGTMESSDICVEVGPSDMPEIRIYLKSPVEKQYGSQIRKTIEQTLRSQGVTAAVVSAVDRGALDCTIVARTLTALQRAVEKSEMKECENHGELA